MAIIVEEEKSQSNLVDALGWIFILVVIVIAAYYLFLAAPTPAVVTPPPSLQAISSITQINFDPTIVTNSSIFLSLKQPIAEPTSTGPVPVGRQNPFVAP